VAESLNGCGFQPRDFNLPTIYLCCIKHGTRLPDSTKISFYSPFQKMKILLTSLAIGFFATTLSAQAQAHHIYGVRETVGTVETRGWERSITQNNPNLSHWTWMPIYSNIQAIDGPPRAATSEPNQSQRQPQPQPQATIVPQQHYVKPIHIALPVPEWRKNLPSYPNRSGDVSGSLHHEQVSGNLMNKKVAAALIPKPALVASYGNYSAPSGYGSSSSVERTDVRGHIASGTTVGRLIRPQ
jgi:hypothetical protein